VIWIMEIQIKNATTGEREWHAVRPSGGEPYRYETKQEAEKMLRICYGPPLMDSDKQRVREVGHCEAL
jgi:hypothetical protein